MITYHVLMIFAYQIYDFYIYFIVITCLKLKNIFKNILNEEAMHYASNFFFVSNRQKQSHRDVLKKRCSENMQQIYRRTSMPKLQSNFIEIALRHGCSPVNLLHIFRTPFPRNTSGWLLLNSIALIY